MAHFENDFDNMLINNDPIISAEDSEIDVIGGGGGASGGGSGGSGTGGGESIAEDDTLLQPPPDSGTTDGTTGGGTSGGISILPPTPPVEKEDTKIGSTYSFRVVSSVINAEISINDNSTGKSTPHIFDFVWDQTQTEYIRHIISVSLEGFKTPRKKILRVYRTESVGVYDFRIFNEFGSLLAEFKNNTYAEINFDLVPEEMVLIIVPTPIRKVTFLSNFSEVDSILVDNRPIAINESTLVRDGNTIRLDPPFNTIGTLEFDGIRYRLDEDGSDFINLDLDNSNGADLLVTGNLIVEIVYRRLAPVPIPIITSVPENITKTVEDELTNAVVTFSVESKNTNRLELSSNKINLTKTITVEEIPTVINLDFIKDFIELGGTIGKYILTLTPIGEGDISGASVQIFLEFIKRQREPTITSIIHSRVVDIPPYVGGDKEFIISWTSDSADKVTLVSPNNIFMANLEANGSVALNFKNLNIEFGDANFQLIPYRSKNAGVARNFNIFFTEPEKLSRDIVLGKFYDVYDSLINLDIPYKIASDNQRYLRNLMNFGNDNQMLITTWIPDDITFEYNSTNVKLAGSIILKLYEPLPSNITLNNQLWVSKEITPPRIDSTIFTSTDKSECIILKPANLNIDIDGVGGAEFGFKTFNELISSGSSTSQDIITHFLSGSIDSKELGIDYTNFEEFVHFSSAIERLENFRYKLRLVESYDKSINTIDAATASLSSPTIQSERNSVLNNKNTLIGGFDGYENHLYSGTGLTSWPKSGSLNYHSTASNSTTWFTSQSAEVYVYDNNNKDYLVNSLPEYLVGDSENSEFLLFVAMIGHHFDILWSYINALRNVKNITNASIGGIPDELVYNMLVSLGWKVKHGNAGESLWKYALGKDQAGNTLSTISGHDYTSEVWRRILNNLPYLLKHKGTKRGIQALITCYGIPESILSIREYGGPSPNINKKATYTFTDYSTAIVMTPAANISVPWIDTQLGRRPDGVELVIATPTSSDYTVVESNNSTWNLALIETTASLNLGIVRLSVSGSGSVLYELNSAELPIFDGDYYSILINRASGALDVFDMYVKKSDGTQIIQDDSGSLSVSSSQWDVGTSINIGQSYVGKIDEFRLWNSVLNESAFINHVNYAEAINGNHTSASTVDLEFRLSFGQAKNEGSGSDTFISSSSPTQTYATFATASGFDNITTFPYNYATFNKTSTAQVPDIGSSRFINNKVRFETQTITGDLSPYIRVTQKSFDQTPVDLNKVGVFFSPSDVVNRDIVRSLGGEDITNRIADPEAQFSQSYNELQELNDYYWSRFSSTSANDIWEYMRLIQYFDKSLFEHIKQLAPARSNISVGVLIEPHMLERSRGFIHRKPSKNDLHYESIIHHSESIILTSNFSKYESVINVADEDSVVLSGSDFLYSALIDDSTIISSSGTYDLYDSVIIFTGSENLSASYDTYTGTATELIPTASISAFADAFVFKVFGMSISGELPDDPILGKPQTRFGIYANSGSTDLIYTKDGVRSHRRVKLELITETITKNISQLISGSNVEYEIIQVTESIERLNAINITGSHTTNAVLLDGYSYPHHRRYTSDLSTGLENSFYNGALQTINTTLDGGSPIEIFNTNPNILKVNKAGRDVSEPILEVE